MKRIWYRLKHAIKDWLESRRTYANDHEALKSLGREDFQNFQEYLKNYPVSVEMFPKDMVNSVMSAFDYKMTREAILGTRQQLNLTRLHILASTENTIDITDLYPYGKWLKLNELIDHLKKTVAAHDPKNGPLLINYEIKQYRKDDTEREN